MVAMAARARTGGAIGKLRKLVANLRSIGDGTAVRATLERMQTQIETVAKGRLAKHTDKGLAAATMSVVTHESRVAILKQRYLGFHKWWPFKNKMPAFIVKNAAKVFEEETKKLLTAK
jgi:hypothetical protein